jgi:DUF1680 family protein
MRVPGSSDVLSRRGFGALLTAAAGVSELAAQQSPAPPPAAPNTAAPRRTGPPPEVPPFEGTIQFARKDAPFKARPFPMAQVRLLPGIYKNAQEWNRGYMHRLDAGRLLYNFRQNAGLPAGLAQPLGGWEAPADGAHGTELRGHFTGHFFSASALLFASTGDTDAKAKADEMVAELAKCQDKLGDGYLSAFPTALFDRLDSGRNLPWAPFYTIHKIMAGLFDMYQLAGNRQALDVAQGMAGWADRWSAPKTEEHMQEILNVEFGGMGETLYSLAAATGNDQWARAGDRFTKKRFVNPLASRRDELRGLHVNTHIPQVIAAARRYEISGDLRFHDVADFFWWEVTTARSYVTGGTSNGESWQTQPRQLGAELKRSTNTAECCCAYNMLKLTRHLYGWNPDPRYFDYYERVMLNHRLGTIRPEKGYSQYYLSLTPGAYKTFGSEDHSFWCCTGTGVEEYAKLVDSIYWRDEQGIYVNQFIASELDWSEKGLKLRQETRFPEEQGTSLAVTAAKPVQMALRLRIPSWLEASPTVKVNGKAMEASASPGSYLTLARTWKTGDRIEMALPMRLSIEAMPDEPQTQAVLYGPLVLAGDLGGDGLTDQTTIGQMGPRVNRSAIEIPAIHAPAADPASWLKPAGRPLTFRTAGQPKDLDLAPLNSIFDKRYVVYWQVG